MPETECSGQLRAELFVRSELPAPATARYRTVVRELETLVESGHLAALSVTEWRKRVPVDGPGGDRERERYAEFSDWASEAGVGLAPFFDTRVCYSTETARRRPELVVPAMCLAVYHGDELALVTPHDDHGRMVSIEDCLDRIRSGQITDAATRELSAPTAD
ncbi:MAG: HTH domain-containing protein [Haloarculaceae archaeon]